MLLNKLILEITSAVGISGISQNLFGGLLTRPNVKKKKRKKRKKRKKKKSTNVPLA